MTRLLLTRSKFTEKLLYTVFQGLVRGKAYQEYISLLSVDL
jgi:hypothetical protein